MSSRGNSMDLLRLITACMLIRLRTIMPKYIMYTFASITFSDFLTLYRSSDSIFWLSCNQIFVSGEATSDKCSADKQGSRYTCFLIVATQNYEVSF